MKRTVFLLALLIVTWTEAENTTMWENATYEDFAKGTLQYTVLYSDGTVRVGKRTDVTQSPEPTLWSLTSNNRGNVYVGTGFTGVIYRLDNTLQKYCDTGELIVTALEAQEDDLYAGTIPNGKVFHIRDGQPTLLAQLPSIYIWAIKLYQRKLYVATGPDGVLYEVDLDSRQTKVLAKTPEKHLLSLALDGQNLYVGSAPNGILYQLTPDGRMAAVVDLPQNEIRALAACDGKIYIGANSTQKFDNAAMAQNLAKKVQQQAEGKVLERKKLLEEMLSGALYVYSTKGWQKLLDLDKDFATCIIAAGDRALLGTGLQGKIYEVQSKDIYSIIQDTKEDQIMAMWGVNGKLQFFCTGDSAKLYRAESTFVPDEANYLSQVHDGQSVSQWSSLYWESEGKLAVQTRTGNTEKPDDFWSQWSSLYPSGYPYIKIGNPVGRYFQYRVVWREPDAVLKTVRVLYSRQNRSPEITELKMELPDKNPRNLYLSKPVNPIKISWKAEDPDGETLRYHLWYKHSQSDYWYELTARDVLTAKEYKWDTSQIADGYYLVKLVASDEIENTTPTFSARLSRPILIDNYPPGIKAQIEKNTISGIVIDSFSFITQIGYRVNEGEWVLVPAADGLCDNQQESFRFLLPALSHGSYTLQIKAMDAAGNTGYIFCTVQDSEK